MVSVYQVFGSGQFTWTTLERTRGPDLKDGVRR